MKQTQVELLNSDAPMLSALLASLVACGLPLFGGLTEDDWSLRRTIGYALVAAIYIVLQAAPDKYRWLYSLREHYTPMFLLVSALLGMILQVLSQEYAIQAIVFMIPLVHAAMHYRFPVVWAWTGFYIAALIVSWLISGLRPGPAFWNGVFAQSSLLVFVMMFGFIAAAQMRLTERAHALSQELAFERDYLQRLVQVNATMSSNMAPQQVLGYVAQAAVQLLTVPAARVWLKEDELWSLEAEEGQIPSHWQVVPPDQAASTALPLKIRGEIIGILDLLPATQQAATAIDSSSIQPFLDAASVAIHNAQLYQQAQISATLAERNRVARELHDTLAQSITALRLQLEAANRAWDSNPERAHQRMQRALELAQTTLNDVRNSVWDLGSTELQYSTFDQALQAQLIAWADQLDGFEYSISGQAGQLEQRVAMHLLRIVNEVLANVQKHAQATKTTFTCVYKPYQLDLEVCDNGRGFDPQNPVSVEGGYGLISLRERARLIDAQIEIVSQPLAGTCVRCTVPLVGKELEHD